jgi:pimeloyl-ACP methyl ester carboxylesterase
MMGGSNGGHHARWMLESYPEIYAGGIAGYGFNSQVSQWGSIATVLRHYAVLEPRIDDVIARRRAEPAWDPARQPLEPPLTPVQLQSLGRIYRIPAGLADGFAYDVGRWPGSEAEWKAGRDALVGYLRDSMPRFDPGFNPGGGPLEDGELKDWDPTESAPAALAELRRLDLTGLLTRPVLIMHGTADAIVSPGETTGYLRLVEARRGAAAAREVVAAYFIPGMGHGGTAYDDLLGEQLDVLERWIDHRESDGGRGEPPPDTLGGHPRAR